MNYNRHVLALSVCCFLVLLLFSLMVSSDPVSYGLAERISIVSDIKTIADQKTALSINLDSTNQTTQELNLQTPNIITTFDSSKPTIGFRSFSKKLKELRRTRKGKIRIAWFGDSMIEGDLITQTIRRILQDSTNSQHGVGFVAPSTVSSKNRITAVSSINGSYLTYNFKKPNKNYPLFYSGYVYSMQNAICKVEDRTNTIDDIASKKFKYLVCGPGKDDTITVDKKPMVIHPEKAINYILIDSSSNSSIICNMQNSTLPFYGISIEPSDGIILDNFSFRGITGVEFKSINPLLTKEIATSGHYDLIVFQFGVNLLFRPNDTQYQYYYELMEPVLRTFSEHFCKQDILIISTFDRAFKYSGQWESAKGIDSLIYVQYRLAKDYNLSFYNLYQTMGGKGTIVNWAENPTPLANRDYVHPNFRGAEKIGATIANDILKTTQN